MRRLLPLAALLFLSSAAALEQFTPDLSDWSTFETKPFGGSNTGHDPDGVGWISQDAWQEAEWDGTIYNPSQMSRAELADAICVGGGDRIRGIREVFYQNNPFADNSNPTKAEVDEWHRIAINHVRALVGYTHPDRLVQKDHCMFARSLWGQQRMHTTQWDADYTGTLGSAYGPCVGQPTPRNAHCGASFVPSAEDQAPFLPSGHDACGTPGGSEGVFSAPKSNIPWSIKWSRALCSVLGSEGFWGGHVGPFFHREKFGFSFWDNDPSDNNNNAILRAKWTGQLKSNLYCNPADSDCNPSESGPDPDGDGYVAEEDCDNLNALVYPGATESCDGLDNNCDGTVDEGCDLDQDGYVVDDCDENNANINPGASEVCDDNVDNNCDGFVDEGCVQLTQYTPSQATEFESLTTVPLSSGNTGHDPDGVFWINNWENWDGTIYNPSLLSKSQFHKSICPSDDRIRGIHTLFYEKNRFADLANPTKAEVDEWHRVAINHIRAMVGYTQEERQIKADHCLFARSLWSQMVRFTNTLGTQCCWGCHGCQRNFIPSAEQQVEYLPSGHETCTAETNDFEVKNNYPKTNIPWAVKWSRGFCRELGSRGFFHNNIKPFFHAEKFGISFWNGGASAYMRVKFAGENQPSLWCNPADAGCDPNPNEAGYTVPVASGCAAVGAMAAAGAAYAYARKKRAEEEEKGRAKPRLAAWTEDGKMLGEMALEEGKEVTVGLEQPAPFKLEHESCAGAHAVVKLEGGQLTITDLGSANGTKLNGEALAPHTATPLHNGSNVSFGNDATHWVVGGLAEKEGAGQNSSELVVDATALNEMRRLSHEGAAAPPVKHEPAGGPGLALKVRKVSAEELAAMGNVRKISAEDAARLGLSKVHQAQNQC